MIADGEQRNHQGQGGLKVDIFRSRVHLISKGLEPSLHDRISRRPGDHIGNEGQLDELGGRQQNDSVDRCAHHFANADLFGP